MRGMLPYGQQRSGFKARALQIRKFSAQGIIHGVPPQRKSREMVGPIVFQYRPVMWVAGDTGVVLPWGPAQLETELVFWGTGSDFLIILLVVSGQPWPVDFLALE
jgi:hypothetical protein